MSIRVSQRGQEGTRETDQTRVFRPDPHMQSSGPDWEEAWRGKSQKSSGLEEKNQKPSPYKPGKQKA